MRQLKSSVSWCVLDDGFVLFQILSDDDDFVENKPSRPAAKKPSRDKKVQPLSPKQTKHELKASLETSGSSGRQSRLSLDERLFQVNRSLSRG
jgi:hypothetical protein